MSDDRDKKIWEWMGVTDPQWEPDYDCFVTYWEPCLIHVEHEPESETHGERWLLRINDLNVLHELVEKLSYQQKVEWAAYIVTSIKGVRLWRDVHDYEIAQASAEQRLTALRKVIGGK